MTDTSSLMGTNLVTMIVAAITSLIVSLGAFQPGDTEPKPVDTVSVAAGSGAPSVSEAPDSESAKPESTLPAPAAPMPPVAEAPTSGEVPATTGTSPAATGGEVPLVKGTGQAIKVTTAAELTTALSNAKPGDTIELADGTYAGKFVLAKAGAAGRPVTLKGSTKAVLDGGAPSSTGYTLHLTGANYSQLVGFTVTGGDKGIMTDKTNHAVLDGLTVGNVGSEAVHFGNFSSDNTVQRSTIHNTGKTKPQFGEGLYFGTAKSNWAKKSGGQPDKSNNTKAINNTFKNTAAENIDVKEETSGGLISGNRFDATGISGQNFADSVLDLKGVNYRVVNNTTTGSSPKLKDGFQTHVITTPATSGCNNTFGNNTFTGVTFNGGQEIALDKKCGGGKGNG